MDRYVTGAVIRQLREKRWLTQAELAERLNVSDKTVSKWETGRGYPDITLLEPIAEVFGISLTELLAGDPVSNGNVSANMLRSVFYVCPVCGNVIHSMGSAEIHCHGVRLTPCEAERSDEDHKILIEGAEDEYYVQIEHEMTKRHHISFIAGLSTDKLQLVKLYPEWNAEARLKMDGVERICCYCNRDGLFYIDTRPGIDDRQRGYDDAQERRELEAAARALLG